MVNSKNSKMTKVVSGLVSLATAIMMIPAIASAATVEELTAQINALLSQVSTLQGGSTMTTSSTYSFTKDLKLGAKGADVTNLQKVLVAKGYLTMPSGAAYGTFGLVTKSAVMKWQKAAGITPVSGMVGPKSRAVLNASGTVVTGGTTTGGTVVINGTGVAATLDMSSPAASSVIQGASTKAAVFKVSNMGSTPAKVTSVKLKRVGVSSDSSIRNVYLYNGSLRITDAATVAQGVVSFNDNSGIITIPAGTSILLGVMVEVDPTAGVGETLGFMLTDVMTDTGTATAGLPVSGAQHNVVAAPNGMTVVSFNSNTNPSISGYVDPQTDYVMWQNTVNIQSRDALLSMIRFRQTGSVAQGDLKNFRLYVGGVQVGTAVDRVGLDGYVTFDFSANPVALKSGGREIKLLGDIVAGSNKTFAFSVQQSVDAQFWDSQLNVIVAPVTAPSTTAFAAVAGASQTVNPGQLTITKSTDSPSGNVINQGSGVTLAKFDFKASGEKLKVENLKIGFVSYNAAVGKIRNGAIFANGVQIGSTQDLLKHGDGGKQFNLGSSLILEPGVTTVVEVRGDVFDNDGTNSLVNGDTIIIAVDPSTSNVYKMSSYGYLSEPASAVAASALTVSDGSITVSKYSAYADQTVVVPQTAYKVGEFRITSGSTEGINLSSFTLDFGSSTASVTNLQNVYLMYGSKTTITKSTVSSTGNTYSINEALPANSTMNVGVYATLNSAITATQTVVPTLTVTGTSQNAGNSVNVNQTRGQTMTVNTGTFTVSVDASTPVTANVVANSMPKVASIKFTSQFDNYTITELWFNATGSAAISELVVKDGATEVKRQAFNGTDLKMTGLSLNVPTNMSKVLDVYANLGSVGTGYAATGQNVGATLYGYKNRDSNGVEALTTGASVGGNSFYAYKTKPTITNVALPTSVLTSGTMTVGKFTITADAGGTVAWRKLLLNYTLGGVGVATSTWNIYDAANESTPLVNVAPASAASGVVTFTSSVDQEISGSKTYVVKVDVTGSVANGASFSTKIPTGVSVHSAPAAYAGVDAGSTFTWSDESVTPHTALTADWNDDFLVKNIPTDSQTLTK